ncbi:hypothetical protein BD769DRAFT_1383921 [Suillus cothurnatus]|nr:hypothetical protein BD769DRAFT_1383921 [Suillus cothurnatus]
MTGTRRRSVQWYNFALIEVQECIDDPINFEASLAADQLVEWRRDIEAWEADCSQPNPFEVMTQAAVHLALSMAEAAEIEHGNNMSLHNDISPSVLILLGLELKDQQLSYKDTFIWGQRANTQANGIINNAEHHINTLSLKYSTARDALVNLAARLGKTDDWERSLKPLNKQRDADPLKHNGGQTVGQPTLCIEWCKARAQAHHWEEEVQLLWEEMCRIVAFLDWQAGWWDMQGLQHAFDSLQAGEGALAYAQCQANLH